MAEKLASLNEQLDELLVKQLELIQDYINVTVECESHQKNGFINLAKARYIQGSHTVSRNCLFSEDADEEREALLKVNRQSKEMEFEFQKSKEEGENSAITYDQPELSISSDNVVESQLNKQFGFLSSTTLKQAKKDFQRCLEKTMERAAIVDQSVVIGKLYKKLMKEKLKIQKDVPAP